MGSEENARELESEEDKGFSQESSAVVTMGSGGSRGEEPFLLACCSRATVCRFTHVKT